VTATARLRTALRGFPRLLLAVRVLNSLTTPVRRSPAAARVYPAYWRSYRRYVRAGGALRFRDSVPMLGDATGTHGVDPHYFYMGAWAAGRIARRGTKLHHDVGSQSGFVAFLTAVTEVRFIDIRPIGLPLPRLTEQEGSVLALPFPDRSVASLSCLHVAEHVGLGRYGDPLDPRGTVRAAAELSRVLAPGGSLYFALPVGRARTEFNAHRVHAIADVVGLFAELELVDFSIVTDEGRCELGAPTSGWEDQSYACGMFEFRRVAA
jgi:SAM-dependent methyltransferase